MLSGALVDMWHCDAPGLYSDISAQRAVGQRFLRGYLLARVQLRNAPVTDPIRQLRAPPQLALESALLPEDRLLLPEACLDA